MISEDKYQINVAQLKNDFVQLNNKEILSKYFYNVTSPEAITEDEYKELKSELRKLFFLSNDDYILIIGSAAHGFSWNPTKPFLKKFDDDSDIDIAIISRNLFELYWTTARDICNQLIFWKEMNLFENYMFNGWMRPDKASNDLHKRRRFDWFGEMNNLSKYVFKGKYQVSVGLFYSKDFFEAYYINAIKQIRKRVEIYE